VNSQYFSKSMTTKKVMISDLEEPLLLLLLGIFFSDTMSVRVLTNLAYCVPD